LLSKPFRCPKPNCNKSYKQANGLKYHMTHGSCNFAPPKDLEHVKDLLERKRRERDAQTLANGGQPLNGSLSTGSNVNDNQQGQIGGLAATLDTALLNSYCDLNLQSMNITETELREVEREAEKRLRPFACGVGDCQRRYKNVNGLRYHYQHSGEHGAVGLALLASGQHECL
jgi:transcription factor SFP1